MKEAAINSGGEKEEDEDAGEKSNISLQRWECTSKLTRKTELETKRQKEGVKVGGDVTFHHATVATLDVCEKLPLRVPFNARRPRRMTCDC